MKPAPIMGMVGGIFVSNGVCMFMMMAQAKTDIGSFGDVKMGACNLLAGRQESRQLTFWKS
jgi:hypothetical protein